MDAPWRVDVARDVRALRLAQDDGQPRLHVEQVAGHAGADGVLDAAAFAIVPVGRPAYRQQPVGPIPGVRVHAIARQVAIVVIGEARVGDLVEDLNLCCLNEQGFPESDYGII